MPNYLLPEGGRKAADDLLRRYREWKAEYTGKKMVDTPFGPAEQKPDLLRNAAVGAGEFLLGGEPGSVDSARQNLLGFAMPIAYHGTPNHFDRFDSSRIGSGEGAQSYGHGLYFAENPAVAKEYQTTLSQGIKGGGYMYKVDIPDGIVSKMLDWDKPLSKQGNVSKPVLGYIKSNYGSLENVNKALGLKLKDFSEIRGQEAYYLMNALGKGDAGKSAALNDLGIPGIRYLDQGSRGTGKGTYNYVVFNDKDVKILERK